MSVLFTTTSCNAFSPKTTKHDMSSLNRLFRRKSSRKGTALNSMTSKAPVENSPPNFNAPAFSAPTRRPQNPPTVANPFSTPSANNEAPPSYTPATTSVAPSTDSPYASLGDFDTIFLIDDSGSMAGRSWRETSQALAAIAPICTIHDKDGVDIYFLNARDEPSYKNVTSAADVQRIFNSVRPSGGTPTGRRLRKLLQSYLDECKDKGNDFDAVKPLNIIVITDGVPTDDPESIIVWAAEKLDKLDAPPSQVGIQFFQVGEEAGAAEALRELDDNLKDEHGIRDIVDTVPWKGQAGTGLNAEGILKVVLGSVNKRLDRKRVSVDGRPAH